MRAERNERGVMHNEAGLCRTDTRGQDHGDRAQIPRLVQIREECTDDSAAQVADVERLGDIRRGIFYDYALACAGAVRAELGLFGWRVICKCVDLVEYEAGEGGCAKSEVEEGLVVHYRLDPFIGCELGGYMHFGQYWKPTMRFRVNTVMVNCTA